MNESKLLDYQNPPGFDINFDLLQDFEANLDPQSPESGNIPCHILGYGEISTVFELKVEQMEDLAFKLMTIFETQE